MVLVGSAIYLPSTPANKAIRLDRIGIALFALATLLVVFPLIEGRAYGWPWWIVAMLVVAPVAAGAFYLWERGQGERKRPELLPASLLGNGQFIGGLVTVTLFFSGIPGLFLVLAMVLQSGFGMTPLESGVTTMPFPAGVMIASLLSGRLGAGFLRLRVGLGSLLLATGMIFLHVSLAGAAVPLAGAALLPPLLLCGLGMGVAISALFQSLMSGVAAAESGAASGALQAFQHLGGALGIAITGQVFFSSLGAASAPEVFGQAAANSTWYQIGIFAVIAVVNIVLSMRASAVRSVETTQT
jgi:predicted MFS family arabinose efflux permease